jgi:hypothetical protein
MFGHVSRIHCLHISANSLSNLHPTHSPPPPPPPTHDCRTDSTDAIEAAMAALTNVSARAAVPMASGIANLGGATLDLAGGEYLVSRPIVIPPMVGNVRIR